MNERIAKLLAMPDDDLNRVAALALGWEWDEDCGVYWRDPVFVDGEIIDYRDQEIYWSPATDHNDAARVKRACGENGVECRDSFCRLLILIAENGETFGLHRAAEGRWFDWKIFNASPREITTAAIAAIESNKKAPAGD